MVVPPDGGHAYEVGLWTRAAAFLTPTWRLQVRTGPGWSVVAGEEHVVPSPVTDGAGATDFEHRVALIRDPFAAPRWLVLDVSAVDSDRRFDPLNWRLYFEVDGTGLVRGDATTYMRDVYGLDPGGPAVLRAGELVPGRAEVRHLAPWDNPDLPAALREEARRAYDDGAGVVAIESAALTIASPNTEAVRDDATIGGCSTGAQGETALWVLLVVGLAVVARRRHVRGLAVGLGAIAMVPMVTPSAHAVTKGVYGVVQYWDTRDRSNATGSRRPECDDSVTTCVAYASGCCFSGVPVADIQLMRKTSPGVYTSVSTSKTWSTTEGFYLLEDTNWQLGNIYVLRVTYTNTGWPASYSLRNNAAVVYSKISSEFTMSSSSQWVNYDYYVNAAGDTTSSAGDMAAIWRSHYDAFIALEAENETRHRNTSWYGDSYPNTYSAYQVRYPCTSCGQGATLCSSNIIQAPAAGARGDNPVRYFGLLYIGRVTGCSTNDTLYPKQGVNMFSAPTQPEGFALTAGLADVVSLLVHWNPNTASSLSIFNEYRDCDNTAYQNTNFASMARNNQLAIWELLDTSTAAQFPFYTDSVDLDLHDLMDSMLTLKGTTGYPGQNRSNVERVLNNTYTSCSDSDDCSAGHACYLQYCRSGDPHGENIFDWAYHAALDKGASTFAYRDTVSSSYCMTGYDNSYPFTGGFRED